MGSATQDWWACSDLNREPRHYECHALTIELQARHNQPRRVIVLASFRTSTFSRRLGVCSSNATELGVRRETVRRLVRRKVPRKLTGLRRILIPRVQRYLEVGEGVSHTVKTLSTSGPVAEGTS